MQLSLVCSASGVYYFSQPWVLISQEFVQGIVLSESTNHVYQSEVKKCSEEKETSADVNVKVRNREKLQTKARRNSDVCVCV